jgi:protein PhnA
MENIPNCPQCQSANVYPMDNLFICPECGYEWIQGAEVESSKVDESAVFDVNGNELQDGDSVVVIKDLPVKGAPKAVKAGTKVKSIRLVDGDHDIACKIDGFGSMYLKSEFVRKA